MGLKLGISLLFLFALVIGLTTFVSADNQVFDNVNHNRYNIYNISNVSAINGNFSGNVSASWFNGNVLWTNIRNFVFSLWTSQNENNLLITNGTALGYNATILNNTIDNRVSVNISGYGFITSAVANATYYFITNPNNFINITTGQFFNDTSLIMAVNTTNNIMGLGFYNTSQIDALLGAAGNSSWNQTYANTLYASIIWGYNQTVPANEYTDVRVGTNNLHLHSILNITGIDDNACSAGQFVTNVTFNNGVISILCDTPVGGGDITAVLGDAYITNGTTSGDVHLVFNETLLNNTIDSRSVGNASWNESRANSLYSSIIWNYNQTLAAINDINSRFWNRTQTYNNTEIDTLLQGVGNSSWNESRANTLYAPIIWGYNQTIGAIDDINARFWNRTQSYNRTEIDGFNASWSTTFNSTYNNLINQQCPAGFVVNGTLINGTFTCIQDQTGGSGFSPNGTIILYKSNGNQTYFSPSSNTDSARGTILLSAQGNASNGDTIMVLNGNYSIVSSLGKHGVSYFFNPNTKVYSVDNDVYVFSDHLQNANFTVAGSGVFETTNSTVANFINGSTITLRGKSLTSRGLSKPGIYTENANTLVYVEFSDFIYSTEYDAIWVNSGDIFYQTPKLIGGDNALEVSGIGSEVYGNAEVYQSTNNRTIVDNYAIRLVGTSNEVYISGRVAFNNNASTYGIRSEAIGGKAIVQVDEVRNPISFVAHANFVLKDTKIISVDSTRPPLNLQAGLGPNNNLHLENVWLIANDSGTFSIDGVNGRSVNITGLLTNNKPISSNITLQYNTIIPSTQINNTHFLNLSGTNANQNVNIGVFNLTTTGSGFFSFLGSISSRITKGWFTSVDVSTGGINSSGNITLHDRICFGDNCGNFTRLNNTCLIIQGPTSRHEIC